MFKKKIALSFLVVTLLLTQLIISVSAYSDVSSSEPYSGVVNKWGSTLITGDVANATAAVTRAEFSHVLNVVMKFPAASATFSDVSSNAYAADIGALQAAGVVAGRGNNIFSPDDVLRRDEMAVMLAHAIGLEAQGTPTFADAAVIPAWAAKYINSLNEGGYMAGDPDGNFSPGRQLRRYEVFHVIENMAKNYVDTTSPVSKVVDGNMLITAPGAVVKNVTVKGDIIIAASVGNGEVTLDGVTLTGTLIVRGGGVNSIIIKGNSHIGRVFIEKTTDGGVRLVTEGGAVVEAVIVSDGKDDVIIEGAIGELVMAADGVPLTINATIETLNVTAAGSSVVIGEKASIASVYTAPSAVGGELTVSGSVGTLQIASPSTTVDVAATATVHDLSLAGAAVGSEISNHGHIDTMTIKTADAVVANDGVIDAAATPVTVTVTGTAPTAETVVEATSVNDIY